MELNKKTITIMGCEVKTTSNGSTQYKLKDHENKTYNLWQTKADGNETLAYQGFKNLPSNGVGRNVEIMFKEDPFEMNGKQLTSKTITVLREVGGASLANTVAKTGMFTENKEKEEKKWEELGWKKCKYGFLIEAFKKDLQLETVENIAEKWADACQRDTRVLKYEDLGEVINNSNNEINIEDIPF